MPYDRFLIAPFQSGLRTNLRPWIIPEDAFAVLNNAYVFRGRVRKRFGGKLTGFGAPDSLHAPFFSRLSVSVDTTDGSGDTTPGVMVPGNQFNIGQAFTIGPEIFTIVVDGTPGVMLTTGASTVHTFDTTTGAFVIHGAAPGTEVFWYPALPVMGIAIYENDSPILDEPTVAWDTEFMYEYNTSFWERIAGSPVWKGTNLKFFWAYNWTGLPGTNFMYITNFNATVPVPSVSDDPMWYWTGSAFFNFSDVTTFDAADDFVASAKIIVAFHNSLLLLYTIEQTAGPTNTGFPNRCRFSANAQDPTNPTSWLQQQSVGWVGGGFIDAATSEAIVTAEFIKDRLIVYFERSTWEIVWTGNGADPFRWQKINTELGADSTFSAVPFDKHVLAIGNVGVHACNGSNVERIDENIPDNVFQIGFRNDGIERIHGIRDYFAECVYWTFPSDNENFFFTYPNQVLVYNYRNQTWAYNDDSITAFGYWNGQVGQTWNQLFYTWETFVGGWTTGFFQPNVQQVLAGNQEGFIFIVNIDSTRNAPVLQITNMLINTPDFVDLTIIDHTIDVGEYVLIENVQGAVGITGIYPVTVVIDADTIRIGPALFTSVYTGGGTVTRVSNYNIQSKQWNPYVDKDRNVYVQRIDFGVDKTAAGQVTVDYFPSSTELSMVDEGFATNTIMGTGVLETSPYMTIDGAVLYPLEQLQTRLWHPVYLQVDGECIQIAIYMNPGQITNINIALSDFQIDGMILYTAPTSARLQ
jgi:hypothetical protein